MTQEQSIRFNIHVAKLKLNEARNVICIDEIQKLHINSAIEFYIEELKDLKISLNNLISQQSR